MILQVRVAKTRAGSGRAATRHAAPPLALRSQEAAPPQPVGRRI